jgi:diguanylate cyclase (GGDEF)-like protein
MYQSKPVPENTRNNINTIMTMNHQESTTAQQKIDVFTHTISRLEQKVTRLEQELVRAHHFAHHDELTGLPNRSLLRDRLNQAIMQATRHRKQVGLLLLDLDGFKSVNDRLGHGTGDKLLQAVAKRLRSTIRAADTACRYGGDEFVILLPDIDSEQGAAEVLQKLRTHLARPYLVDQYRITITASIGMAVHARGDSSKSDLIRRADTAMYLAKAQSHSASPTIQPAGNWFVLQARPLYAFLRNACASARKRTS